MWWFRGRQEMRALRRAVWMTPAWKTVAYPFVARRTVVLQRHQLGSQDQSSCPWVECSLHRCLSFCWGRSRMILWSNRPLVRRCRCRWTPNHDIISSHCITCVTGQFHRRDALVYFITDIESNSQTSCSTQILTNFCHEKSYTLPIMSTTLALRAYYCFKNNQSGTEQV